MNNEPLEINTEAENFKLLKDFIDSTIAAKRYWSTVSLTECFLHLVNGLDKYAEFKNPKS